MYLYNLTLQKQIGICSAIVGSFSAPKMSEIVISRGNILELYSVDSENSKLVNLISKEVFGQIRKIVPFRLTGNKKDYIIVGSDSGRVVILEADAEKREFVKIHQETFGKTGVRRIVPGEYIGVDPKGRCFLIAAIEKQKFVYITGRDMENKMTISSPLEAHKSHTLCFDLTGLDVGYENPLFACLEADYGEMDDEKALVNTEAKTKILVYYEMDLGLNHVVRKNYETVDDSAHHLVAVPGSNEGPGGVLVFCENFVIYKKANHEDRKTPFPCRNEHPKDKGVMIVASSSYKRKDLFFVLIQTELGDIFKLSMEYTGEVVHGVSIQYFETIPVSVSLCVLPNGYLFSASETSNHYLYNIQSIGDENMITTYSTMKEDSKEYFNPRALKYLFCCEEIPSLSSISDMMVDDLTSDGSPQIYTLCGRSARSSLRILKQGMAVTEVASSSLPGKPLNIWTVKAEAGDKFDKYAIVSFQNSTLVLSIEETVKEIHDSGFDLKKPSLYVASLVDNTFIQVLPNGIIHIKADKKRAFYQTSSKILSATSNSRQIAAALQDREIIYFEAQGDKLEKVESKVLDAEIVSIHIADIPEGRNRSKFLAVGCADNTVRILSLQIDQCLTKISTQILPAVPDSVILTELGGISDNDKNTNGNPLYLFVGLDNGVLMKTAVDSLTGTMSDTRTRYLGSKSVNLFKVQVQNGPAVVANSTKPWLCYNYMHKYYCTSLNYESVDSAASLVSPQCSEGIVSIAGNNFTIFTIDQYGETFHQTVVPLRYTPRRMLTHPDTNNILIIESEQNTLSKREKDLYKKEVAEKTNDMDYLKLKEDQIGLPFAGEGRWASCIRMIEPYEHKLLDLIEFEDNEAAFSACVMSFSSTPGEMFLIVGSAKDMTLHPRTFSSASIIVFAFKEGGKKIDYLHRTPVEDIPLAFSEFQGKLVAGIGPLVRIYEIGKKKLLKKCETKKITSVVTGLNVTGQRIFVNTMNESFHVLRYKPEENQLYLFADDVIPRWLTCATILDYDTIAGADKFENFFVYRLPQGCDEESEEDPMGTKHKWEMGYLHGAAYKMDLISQFHRGDLITSMKKCTLSGGSETMIAYATALGAVGVFLPFETREEVDFFVHLEMYLRLETNPLCGRDHQMYRSAYGPVKCVVDGDLCEDFVSLDFTKQKALSTELDKTPNEILKKLEEIKNKIL